VALHPQVSGRGHRVAMLEQFIAHCRRHGDVRFRRMCDVIADLSNAA
jgi:hypothetical protein